MRILALCHGLYGDRIVRHIREANGENWTVDALTLPRRLPVVIDEPEEYIPSSVPSADLVLAMQESPESAQLIPAIVRRSGAKAAIIPVDNSTWLPVGLKNQLRAEIMGTGVTAVFPRTFCTLTETASGFGEDIEFHSDQLVARFASRFGRLKLDIRLDGQGRIALVKVERTSPCGSTHLVAQRLVGVLASEATPQAGLHAHHFPCLASMAMELNGETLMHISGYVVNDEVRRRLGSQS